MDFQDSILLSEFQRFYYELLRNKEKALRLRVILEQESNTDSNSSINLLQQISAIQNRLYVFFEEQQLRMSKKSTGSHMPFIMDAIYVMVTLADEVFMTADWPGSKEWGNNTLEAKIFQTQIAGEAIFKKIDTLLSNHDPVQKEIALIYLLSLGAGFCGQYRNEESQDRLLYYRKQLYSFVYHQPSTLLHPGRKKLFEVSYNYTLQDATNKTLPDLRTWGMAAGVIILIYVFVTYVLWYHLSYDLHIALTQIFSQTSQGNMP